MSKGSKLPILQFNELKNMHKFSLKKASNDEKQKDLSIKRLFPSLSTRKVVKIEVSEKSLIKSRLLKSMKNQMIMEKTAVEKYKETFSQTKMKYTVRKIKKGLIPFVTNKSPELIKEEKKTPRYEDCYISPKEFLDNYFNKRETKIILNDPDYFLLNRSPFAKSSLKINHSLRDILNSEEIEKQLKLKRRIRQHEYTHKRTINHIMYDNSTNNITINNSQFSTQIKNKTNTSRNSKQKYSLIKNKLFFDLNKSKKNTTIEV